MKQGVTMADVVIVTWGTMKARGLDAKKATQVVGKSFELNDDELLLLETCIVEMLLGISSFKGKSNPFENMTSQGYVDLYKEAVLSPDGTVSVLGTRCSSKAVEKSVGCFLTNCVKGYR